GTYGPGLEDVKHPLAPEMAETPLTLNGVSTSAAKPWADLPQATLDHLAFVHHATNTNSHPNHPKSMRLQGSVVGNEMLLSALAKETATGLMTTQAEPVSLGAGGSELISFEGRRLSNVSPTGLQRALQAPDAPDLASLRDQTLDGLYALYKARGGRKHIRMLDAFARTRREAKQVNVSLLDLLAGIDDQEKTDQEIAAASVLAAMNLTPVITIKIRFGGDNHADADLEDETTETVTGVAYVQKLIDSLNALTTQGVLTNEVVVASMNVFGRTMSLQRKGLNGRDHNPNHHCMLIHGPNIRGGVVGGIEAFGRDFAAAPFDASTGAIDESGVPRSESYEAAAKTLGCAVGVAESRLDELIIGGRPATSILG
ncbi:MAG: DUF1501 domain-containing protein, partial [Myxococcota bacterium]